MVLTFVCFAIYPKTTYWFESYSSRLIFSMIRNIQPHLDLNCVMCLYFFIVFAEILLCKFQIKLALKIPVKFQAKISNKILPKMSSCFLNSSLFEDNCFYVIVMISARKKSFSLESNFYCFLSTSVVSNCVLHILSGTNLIQSWVRIIWCR